MTEKLSSNSNREANGAFAEAMKDAPEFGGGQLQKNGKTWNEYNQEDCKLGDALLTEIYKNIDNEDYKALNGEKIMHYGKEAENMGVSLEPSLLTDGDKEIRCVNICQALIEHDEQGGSWKQYSDFGVNVPLEDFVHPVVSDRGADEKTTKALNSVAAAIANMGINNLDGFKKAVDNGRLGKIER